MHGAANDFIVVDDRALTFPVQDAGWLQHIMRRHTGVGSEGVLLIQPSARADFRMRFFNPDGGEVDMCGNGARCIARLAHELGVAPARMTLETGAGVVGAEMLGERVRLTMTTPKDWRLDRRLRALDREWTYSFVNSGVPHAVLCVENLEALEVQALGAAIRYHADFAPQGTNANFISVSDANTIRLRTYERGVEAETPACGTGIVAAGLIAGRTGLVRPPVKVIPASGDTLEVDFQLTADGAEKVTLFGPAAHVYRGELVYEGT
jgi:diaminopimelate epimerase